MDLITINNTMYAGGSAWLAAYRSGVYTLSELIRLRLVWVAPTGLSRDQVEGNEKNT